MLNTQKLCFARFHNIDGDFSRTIPSFLCCRRLLQGQGKQGTHARVTDK
jgi:hypothetical protein